MKVAIYCRLSKEDKNIGESESIKNQANMLSDYVKKNNWEIYNIYKDDDFSGADEKRPAFCKLLQDAEKRLFDVVLCKSQSRFSRDIRIVEEYLHTKFPLWNIRFISLIDNADTEKKSNKKARQINSLINEWYLEDLSENIRAVFKTKMERGEYLASFAPFGYKKDENVKNHLVPDEEKADVVRFIFLKHSSGDGALKIAQKLNERGEPTPSACKKEKFPDYKGRISYVWTPKMVSSILNNPVYYGHTIQNVTNRINFKSAKKVKVNKEDQIAVYNTHEPLCAGCEYKERIDKSRPQKATGDFLCGKVFCGFCGKRLTRVHTKTSAGRHVTYLRCPSRYLYSGDKKCASPSVILEELLTETKLKAEDFLKEYNIIEKLKKSSTSDKKNTHFQKDIQEKINSFDRAIEMLYLDKADGTISPDDFRKLYKSLNEKKENLKNLGRSPKNSASDSFCYDDFLNVFIKNALHKIVITKEEDKIYADFFWQGK